MKHNPKQSGRGDDERVLEMDRINMKTERTIQEMSTLEVHIGAAISYLETDANIDAALAHLAKATHAAEEATELIRRIGTTGVERTDIIQRAEEWPNKYL